MADAAYLSLYMDMEGSQEAKQNEQNTVKVMQHQFDNAAFTADMDSTVPHPYDIHPPSDMDNTIPHPYDLHPTADMNKPIPYPTAGDAAVAEGDMDDEAGAGPDSYDVIDEDEDNDKGPPHSYELLANATSGKGRGRGRGRGRVMDKVKAIDRGSKAGGMNGDDTLVKSKGATATLDKGKTGGAGVERRAPTPLPRPDLRPKPQTNNEVRSNRAETANERQAHEANLRRLVANSTVSIPDNVLLLQRRHFSFTKCISWLTVVNTCLLLVVLILLAAVLFIVYHLSAGVWLAHPITASPSSDVLVTTPATNESTTVLYDVTTPLDLCANKCLNNGSCTSDMTSNTCTCHQHYYGDHCQFDDRVVNNAIFQVTTLPDQPPSANGTIRFGHVTINNGSAFDDVTDSGVFTAPTEGFYWFHTSVIDSTSFNYTLFYQGVWAEQERLLPVDIGNVRRLAHQSGPNTLSTEVLIRLKRLETVFVATAPANAPTHWLSTITWLGFRLDATMATPVVAFSVIAKQRSFHAEGAIFEEILEDTTSGTLHLTGEEETTTVATTTSSSSSVAMETNSSSDVTIETSVNSSWSDISSHSDSGSASRISYSYFEVPVTGTYYFTLQVPQRTPANGQKATDHVTSFDVYPCVNGMSITSLHVTDMSATTSSRSLMWDLIQGQRVHLKIHSYNSHGKEDSDVTMTWAGFLYQSAPASASAAGSHHEVVNDPAVKAKVAWSVTEEYGYEGHLIMPAMINVDSAHCWHDNVDSSNNSSAGYVRVPTSGMYYVQLATYRRLNGVPSLIVKLSVNNDVIALSMPVSGDSVEEGGNIIWVTGSDARLLQLNTGDILRLSHEGPTLEDIKTTFSGLRLSD